ncbi:MFS transporter [Thalassotalea sp. LPB0316]|uniref:AmpG family muropeptide MFS transporter n=1 Tax=Thalassotalea sp. LPB0316 TaxID=2769490 RepID=UPI0018691F1B|nr:MFS transporter [Thalassotalea sp. LPB0316]QOL26990.1 MFS transporter [Thalassotalea sp. LPB0316]
MSSTRSFWQALQYFKNKTLLTIFCFGIASGFPWVMIGSAMSGWLKDEGLSRSSIGLFGLIFVAYSINFLWSPLVDRIKLFLLHKKLGQRRSWIFTTQLIIAFTCWQMSSLEANQSLAVMAVLGLIIAIAGATQDIAIDAYRIDSLGEQDNNEMAAGSAMATSGWWTGYAGLGAIPFLLADQPDWHWPQIYIVLALIMLALSTVVLFVKEPQSQREQNQSNIERQYQVALQGHKTRQLIVLLTLPLIILTIGYANFGYPYWPEQLIDTNLQFGATSLMVILMLSIFISQMITLNKQVSMTLTRKPADYRNQISDTSTRLTAWLLTTLVAPIHEFFSRNGFKLSLSILLFIFLFKLGEAYLGRMSIVFYREVGFSNADIAYYSKMINWSVTIIFSLIGSIFTIRYGILKGLFIGGIAMSASNLLFSVIAIVGPNKPLFAFTVIVDGFTSAWGSVAFVALLSVLCNKTFTASQYALMASLGTFGRVMLGSYSGIVVDYLNGNWALFFVLTALMVIPSLLFLYAIRKPLNAIIEKNNCTDKESNLV